MSGVDFPEELPASPDVLITAAVRTANDFQNPERGERRVNSLSSSLPGENLENIVIHLTTISMAMLWLDKISTSSSNFPV